MRVEFTDAQEMAIRHPATFEAPDKIELDCIMPGSHVKICAGDERFWVLVTAVTREAITGTIDNDLVRTAIHGLRYNDTVSFERRHVYDIIGKRAWNRTTH
ncbi:hypothetical protein E3L83_19515 [Salmonella enterica]|nr:hypothetical protein [Salmonella enterica]